VAYWARREAGQQADILIEPAEAKIAPDGGQLDD
jgi:hypothetical protein